MILMILKVLMAAPVLYLAISTVITTVMARSSHQQLRRDPGDLGMEFEDVSFPSRVDSVTISGWYIPGGTKGTVIVVHGGKTNRADYGMRLLELCADLARSGFNVLTFDRRGCGSSEAGGLRSRSRFERDLGGALDYVHGRSGAEEPVFFLGFSLGALATVLFTSHEKNNIKGIVCDSCFASTPEMAARVLSAINPVLPAFIPGARYMGRIIFDYHENSAIELIGSISCPIFFIQGEKDDSIPIDDTYALFQASGNPLNEMWIAPDARHAQAYNTHPSRYIQKVADFLTCKCSPRNSAQE